MAEYSNAKQSIYSDLEPAAENVYSQPEVDSDHSDKGSVSGRGSDRDSVGGHRNGSDHGHHNDDHRAHARDRDGSDREDDLSDREDRRSDRGSRQSDRGSRQSDHGSRQSDHGSRQSDHGSRQSDRGSRRSDREDGRSDSHSIHDREGSLHDSVDGTRDRRDSSHDKAYDVYEALDEMNDLVAQAEAEQGLYINADDRKSDDSHSDGEGEGHGRHRGRPGSAAGDVEAIYEEVREHQSDSEDGSEKGGHGRGHGRHSDDLYDDVKDGHHTHENGHQRRGSHDSDDENHRSTVDGGLKRQTSSTAPTSSGKFTLRTSRKADPLHVLRRIQNSSSAEDNPEMDELVTVLRSTDHSSKHEDVMDEESEKIKSFITSKLIHKFEQGIASEDVFNESHDNHHVENHPQINDRPNTTVVKTTVVKTTVKADATSPVTSKGHGIPKSPTSPIAAAVYGSGVASHHSHTSSSSSSSSLSSAPQIHEKSVTHESHVSYPGVTKTSTTTVVTVTPSRHPANELPKTPDDSTVPGWKAEIEMRKKTKSHVPTQKPKEPMKMSEVPEWKKQLQEKNKMKKLSSSDESDITVTRVTTVEMGRVKHEKMVITHGHGGRADNVPEWVRLADEKQKTISH